MLFAELARTSAAVASSSSRLAKVERLAATLRQFTPEEVPVAVAYLSGALPHGSIGVGWASLRTERLPSAAAGPPALQILDVDRLLRRIGATVGPGSQAARAALIGELFGRATEEERQFLFGLLMGEIRQGALEGVMVEAVARSTGLPPSDVRRAAMLAGDLAVVAGAAASDGVRGLARFRLTPLQPVQPMLAQSAPHVMAALERTGRAGIEWKLDGARIQIHRLDDEVRVFTRNLADVTNRVPEVVEVIAGLPARAMVLDAEAIALRPDGRPHRFQVTMGRFGGRLEVERLRADVPLSAFVFDALHLEGGDLIDRPGSERFRALARALRSRPALVVPRIETDDPGEGDAFLDDALSRGHEGVMVKSLDAPYEAGRRGAGWQKVKRAHTLDLVVLAAEWGHGRRRGWLSNLHLGARDPETGGFVMLGKTFKGMTDETLAWQTERFQQLEVGREGIVVHLKPELVVEVAFDGVQTSTRYPAGMALRFARIKGYRPQTGPPDVDTVQTVRAIMDGSSG